MQRPTDSSQAAQAGRDAAVLRAVTSLTWAGGPPTACPQAPGLLLNSSVGCQRSFPEPPGAGGGLQLTYGCARHGPGHLHPYLGTGSLLRPPTRLPAAARAPEAALPASPALRGGCGGRCPRAAGGAPGTGPPRRHQVCPGRSGFYTRVSQPPPSLAVAVLSGFPSPGGCLGAALSLRGSDTAFVKALRRTGGVTGHGLKQPHLGLASCVCFFCRSGALSVSDRGPWPARKEILQLPVQCLSRCSFLFKMCSIGTWPKDGVKRKNKGSFP